MLVPEKTFRKRVLPVLVQYAPFTFALSQKLLASFAAQYPFAEYTVLGRSVTKHGIFSLSVGKGEEQVLLLAGLSGEDGVQPLLLYRFFERLCKSLKNDVPLRAVKFRNTLRGRKITIVPCVNPDAFEIRRYGAVGAGCYAGLVKRAGAEDYSTWCANARGVNVEHNFNFRHISVLPNTAETSGWPSPFSYAGPSPESEAETAALTRLCRREQFRHAVLLAGSGARVFWAAGDSPEGQKDAPMMAKILAAAGDYTLARKEDYIKRGCFPEWFAGETGKPAFEIAVRDLPHEPTGADFEALYAAVEEMLVLCSIM